MLEDRARPDGVEHTVAGISCPLWSPSFHHRSERLEALESRLQARPSAKVNEVTKSVVRINNSFHVTFQALEQALQFNGLMQQRMSDLHRALSQLRAKHSQTAEKLQCVFSELDRKVDSVDWRSAAEMQERRMAKVTSSLGQFVQLEEPLTDRSSSWQTGPLAFTERTLLTHASN